LRAQPLLPKLLPGRTPGPHGSTPLFQSVDCIFHPVTVNFDLWPWPSNST